MTDMPERIWVERPKSDGTGFWQEQPSSWLLPYVRADLLTAERDRILAILDAHPNACPAWLALQIREGRL